MNLNLTKRKHKSELKLHEKVRKRCISGKTMRTHQNNHQSVTEREGEKQLTLKSIQCMPRMRGKKVCLPFAEYPVARQAKKSWELRR